MQQVVKRAEVRPTGVKVWVALARPVEKPFKPYRYGASKPAALRPVVKGGA